MILGGGFAGLRAAMYFDKGLARRSDIEVTMINRENYTLFTPLLHEVASGDLYGADIINPIRRILRHVKFVEADIKSIDLESRSVHCSAGVQALELTFQFDHVLIALGSETNYFDLPGVADWSMTIKSFPDAALLRNRVVARLEEAILLRDEDARRRCLTFVTAGGGFAGVETTGAINDYVRDAMRYYPELSEDSVRIVVVHPDKFLLPELGEELGNYAERKLRERHVDVIKGVRVASYDGSTVQLNNGQSIPAQTLVWAAGVKPSPVVDQLSCPKQKHRILVNEFLGVPDVTSVWACGDSAAVPDPHTKGFYPPTAQHGSREGLVAAKNIEATILRKPLQPFTYKTMGQLASIGHHTGVAMIFGMKFSGFIAWWMWRSVYLAKLPRWPKKLRVMMGWTLDLFFGREIEQMITLRDVEKISRRLAHIPGRSKTVRP